MPANVNIDKNSPKYQFALKFVNKLLKNMKKSEINDLTDFKDIDRDDIITEKNTEMLTKMENELYMYFDKTLCGYYRKTDTYVLTTLRAITKTLGLKLNYVHKDITISVNHRKKFIFYSII